METLREATRSGASAKPEPLLQTDDCGGTKPPSSPMAAAGGDGFENHETLYGYLKSLRDSLASMPPLPPDVEEELLRRFL
ncbi:hypothetical protein Mal52_13640 [Symmachiella dynata]|uniref:Uncharacterized protein n=1 Tax=Symmachiella dynata TaxID=2527995 RepID=A0A517ZKC1_9PLAN|nr:hypothetical protein Mal52_13640 [Symmachiella dynata]